MAKKTWQYFDTFKMALAAINSINEKGFHKSCDGENSTKADMIRTYDSIDVNAELGNSIIATEVLNHWKSVDPHSEYDETCRDIARDDKIVEYHLGFLASMINSNIQANESRIKFAETNKEYLNSKYVGEFGGTVTFVVSSMKVESLMARNGSNYKRITFLGTDGNMYTWVNFGNKDHDSIPGTIVTAKIHSHREYKGVECNYINNCRFKKAKN